MQTAPALNSLQSATDELPAPRHEITKNEPLQFVGQRLNRLSDAEREEHIKSCAWLMEDAMRRWYETGDFGFRGEADRWRLLMEEAIRGRSAAQIAKMEQERGIA